MKGKFQTPIMVILFLLLPLIAFSGAEQTPSRVLLWTIEGFGDTAT